MRRKARERIFAYLMLAPLFALIAIFIVYPVLYAVFLSFVDSKLGATWEQFVGFKNYLYVLQSEEFSRSAVNSVVWLAGNLLFMTIFALGAAVLLNQSFKGVTIARSLMLLTWALPSVVIMVIWKWLLEPSYGLITIFLNPVGIASPPLLSSVDYSLTTLILINTWRFAPFSAILILAALQMVSKDIYDAARMDGASPTNIFLHITLPILKPIFAITSILGTVWSLNVFDVIWLLTQGGPAGSTETLPVLLYRMAFRSFEASRGAAISVMISIVMVIFVLAWFKFVVYRPEKR